MNICLLVLITLLGSPDFACREAASDVLWRLGELARPQLELAACDADAERRYRAMRLLDDLRRVRIEALLAEFQPTPWIDSVPPGHPLAAHRLCFCPWPDCGPDWPAHRERTRDMVGVMLGNGVAEDAVRGLLRRMAERSAFWAENKRYP